jgi:tetratricopeptide (TPR) repeat protein
MNSNEAGFTENEIHRRVAHSHASCSPRPSPEVDSGYDCVNRDLEQDLSLNRVFASVHTRRECSLECVDTLLVRGLCLGVAAAHFQKGMYPEALQDAEKGLALSHPDLYFLSIAAYFYGRQGNVEQAGKLVEEMRAASKKSYVGPFYFATAFVGMGKEKEAIEALEEGYRAHDPEIVGLNSTPWFGPLRSNPRFQSLVSRMHLPPVAGSER